MDGQADMPNILYFISYYHFLFLWMPSIFKMELMGVTSSNGIQSQKGPLPFISSLQYRARDNDYNCIQVATKLSFWTIEDHQSIYLRRDESSVSVMHYNLQPQIILSRFIHSFSGKKHNLKWRVWLVVYLHTRLLSECLFDSKLQDKDGHITISLLAAL